MDLNPSENVPLRFPKLAISETLSMNILTLVRDIYLKLFLLSHSNVIHPKEQQKQEFMVQVLFKNEAYFKC